MTAAQFIDQAKAALDDFGDRGLDTRYDLLTSHSPIVTHKTELDASEFWQCFQEFCVREGKEIM